MDFIPYTIYSNFIFYSNTIFSNVLPFLVNMPIIFLVNLLNYGVPGTDTQVITVFF